MKRAISFYDKSEGRAHPIWIDRCSLIWEKADHHGQEDLKVATDVNDEYHLLVSSGWGGDSCTWWDFFDQREVPHQYFLSLEVVLPTIDRRGTEHVGASQSLLKDSHWYSHYRWEGLGKYQNVGLARIASSFVWVLGNCSSSEKEHHQNGWDHYSDSS